MYQSIHLLYSFSLVPDVINVRLRITWSPIVHCGTTRAWVRGMAAIERHLPAVRRRRRRRQQPPPKDTKTNRLRWLALNPSNHRRVPPLKAPTEEVALSSHSSLSFIYQYTERKLIKPERDRSFNRNIGCRSLIYTLLVTLCLPFFLLQMSSFSLFHLLHSPFSLFILFQQWFVSFFLFELKYQSKV